MYCVGNLGAAEVKMETGRIGSLGRSRLFRATGVLLAVTTTMALALTAFLHIGGSPVLLTLRQPPDPITQAFEAFLKAPLPPVNHNISQQAPLIFFHQRKAAGTSLRAALLNASTAAGLSSFIPCYGAVHCDTYTLQEPAAVYAGHFPWGARKDLARSAAFDPATGSWHSPELNMSCVTMFRDPVARLESCYYYRFLQENEMVRAALAEAPGQARRFSCLANLAPDELRSMFIAGRSRYGRGCLNEPFRIFSGMEDEQDLVSLSTSPLDGPRFQTALHLTLSHLATCVPLILEDPRSRLLAQHWFPQLAGAFGSMQHENKGAMERCPLSSTARAVLEELAAGEQLLYSAVRQRVEAMLAAVDGGQ